MSPIRGSMQALKGGGSRLPSKAIGLIIIAAIMVTALASFSTQRIGSWIKPGHTIYAEFSREYKTRNFEEHVELGGVQVGQITGVDKTERNTTLVSMRVDSGVLEKLGNAPSAAIRPTLVVGGIYQLALTPGGVGNSFAAGDTIPLERTTVPVELDRVLTPINASARRGIQTSIRGLDGTLAPNGQQAVQSLVRNAPPTLTGTADVLRGVDGTRPGRDLPDLVTNLERTAAVFNRRDGQLASILDNLQRTTGALAAARQPLAESFRKSPETLRVTRAGLADLQPTLDRLTDTAPGFRKSAKALEPVLEDLDPVLQRARPVISDLKDLASDARPLVDRLTPTAGQLTQALDDVRGPVLDRVNGPIMDTLNSRFSGTGTYAGGGSDSTLYEETAFLTVAGADVWKFKDQNGTMARLMAGAGGNSATGGASNPRSLEQYLESGGLQQPAGPQDNTRRPRGGVPGLPPIGPTERSAR